MTELKCVCCGEPGTVSQAPWPLPLSECYCNLCYELEGIAYWVWRAMYPQAHKSEAPVPFMKTKADWPPDATSKTLDEIKAFFKSRLEVHAGQ